MCECDSNKADPVALITWSPICPTHKISSHNPNDQNPLLVSFLETPPLPYPLHYITLHPPFITPSFLFIYNNFRDTLNQIFNFCSFIQLSVIDAFYLYKLFTFVNYLLFRKLTSYEIWCENIHVCSICFTTICYLKK